MTHHWENKHFSQMIGGMVIGLVGLWFVFVSFSGENQTDGNSDITFSDVRVSEGGMNVAQDISTLEFPVFTSSDGAESFESPEAWARPLDPRDSMHEAFFVGPIDRLSHRVVFLSVSRYPQARVEGAIKKEIAQLYLNTSYQVMADKSFSINQYPARRITVQEKVTVLLPTVEVVEVPLIESYVFLDDQRSSYGLKYVTSPLSMKSTGLSLIVW